MQSGLFLSKCVINKKNIQYNSEDLYFMLLVTSVVQTVLSISQNGINQITLNKQLSNHLNKDIIYASSALMDQGKSVYSIDQDKKKVITEIREY